MKVRSTSSNIFFHEMAVTFLYALSCAIWTVGKDQKIKINHNFTDDQRDAIEGAFAGSFMVYFQMEEKRYWSTYHNRQGP